MWFDSHCHLKKFAERNCLNEVLVRAAEAKVTRMVAVGTCQEDWSFYQDLVGRKRSIIDFTVGLHPSYVNEGWFNHVKNISDFWDFTDKPVAVGEIGLDYFRLPKEKELSEIMVNHQKEAFQYQLKIAASLDVPIVIHSRSAFDDCLKLIDEAGVNWEKVVFHCFSEGPEEIFKIQERGGWVSFTGILTYKANNLLRNAFKTSAKNQVMIETDSPYLAPVPKRGKENEPAYLSYLGEFAANLWNYSENEFAEKMFINTSTFFNLQISKL